MKHCPTCTIDQSMQCNKTFWDTWFVIKKRHASIFHNFFNVTILRDYVFLLANVLSNKHVDGFSFPVLLSWLDLDYLHIIDFWVTGVNYFTYFTYYYKDNINSNDIIIWFHYYTYFNWQWQMKWQMPPP